MPLNWAHLNKYRPYFFPEVLAQEKNEKGREAEKTFLCCLTLLYLYLTQIEKMKASALPASGKEVMPIMQEFYDFIINDHFPCIMAQTVFRTNNVAFKSYQGFGTDLSTSSILKDLHQYLEGYNFQDNEFFTFIAAFPDERNFTEEEFETLLWKQLQLLHNADSNSWDPTVSNSPENEHFSFSLLGKAFYIVGLHPGSSRISRRSPFPAIVFNLHFQFEKLKEMGSYDAIRDRIRERDMVLQGSINPMVQDFGKESEAKQYSGREVGKNWQCPFHHK